MSLCEWYANREVLLTGVTSELGRALLEKLLRCFPTIKIYLLIRTRNHLNKDDRVKKIFASAGFERLREVDPKAINRVKPIEGNLLYERLSLSKKELETIKNVSVVFHAAGPHNDVFEFCEELPQLKVIAAASTIFKYRGNIEEELQNENIPKIPLALVRMAVLGPPYRDPMPGFIEIMRGPTAMMVGAGMAFGNPDYPAEIIPVDIATNDMISAAWDRGLRDRSDAPTVYNAPTIGCTWGDLIKKGGRANRKFAYPTFGIRGMTSIRALYWFSVFFFEWLPAFICDTILGLFGAKKTILLEYDRVRNALRSLESISSRPWSAERNRMYLLQERLTPEDREAFPLCPEIDIESYVLCAAAAAKKHCVNEHNVTIVRTFRFLFLAIFIATFFYFALTYARLIRVK